MAENIFKTIEDEREAQVAFETLKSDGYRLLQEGKIDAKTYYSKTRDAGIELGLIDERDYPGRLPRFAEGFLEVLGGTGGAIGGFFTAGAYHRSIPGAPSV